jgi:hypothetical protein
MRIPPFKTSSFVFVLVCFALTALGQDAPSPYAVKQDVLGESLAQYQANNPKDCPAPALKPDKDRVAVFCTVVGTTYAGEAINKKKVGFMHERLYLVSMEFPHSSFYAIKSALSEKFGQPVEKYIDQSTFITIAEALSKKEKTHEERLNVPETGIRDNWKNGVSQIAAEEYDILDTNFQTSSLNFTLDALANEAMENMDEANKAKHAKSKSDM